MYISGVVYDSIVDGEGLRNVIFVSGCKHCCKGCHNKKAWNFSYGKEFTIEEQLNFIKECKENILLDGITISGGDPFYSTKDVIDFIKLYKENLPHHSIWIYSGFTYEEILEDEQKKKLLELCDVLVDGLYIEELRDITLEFRGSKNQRIIKLTEYKN